MSERRFYLDEGVGESRGVVTLDGRPERLVIRREGEDDRLLLGARLVARVAAVEPAITTAFLDLGGGAEAILPFKPDSRPVRGQSLEIEIRSEPRAGKLAIARALGPAEGEPVRLASPPELATLLTEWGRGVQPVRGAAAREAADEAEAEALASVHPLPGGGDIAVEATRALTAVDVDLGARKGADAKRVTRQANLAAIGEAARLLRLKSLGGLVVIDLVGRGHDTQALVAAARAAFAPDNPGVAIGGVGRFGTLELSLPRRTRPVSELLCDPAGRLSDLSLALRLVRRLEAEAQAQPGSRIAGDCAPAVARLAEPLAARLAERYGARFLLRPDPLRGREQSEVSAL